MNIFEQLSNNKGTVSSALGKALAQKVLQDGRVDILVECIDLASYEASKPTSKQIRSGAAKVIEIVAEKQPELVASHLEKLLPALAVKEPQTRWMIIRTMGFCAQLNKSVAQKAIKYAEAYIQNKKDGLCLASSADLFLGDFGALSQKDAQKVFPILSLSSDNLIANEQDWILEALLKMLPNLNKDEQSEAFKFSEHWQYSARKSTQQRAGKILRSR